MSEITALIRLPLSSMASALAASEHGLDAIAELLQHADAGRGYIGIVLDQQDRAGHRDPGHGVGAGRRSGEGARLRGRQSVTGVPMPSVLFAFTLPPDWCAKPNTCESPSPVPLPTPLVVKKGSKIFPMQVGRDAHAGVGDGQARQTRRARRGRRRRSRP